MDKKKIIRLIVNVFSIGIIALLVASFIPIGYLTRPVYYTRNLQGFYQEEENSLDVVYVGGSACFVYWEPLRAFNKYGFTSYNYAHDSILPEAPKYYLKEIQKTQSPDLYIVDLRPFQYGDLYHETLHEQSLRAGTDSMPYTKNRFDLINTSIGKDIRKNYTYHFDFFRYKTLVPGMVSNLVSEDGDPFEKINKENDLKGFYFIHNTMEVEFNDYSAVTDILPISDSLNGYFIDLLDYCKSEELNVLFVVHSYCQTKEHKMMYNYMNQVITEYGFGFLNTNDYYNEIGLDYSLDLYNENHVNVFGAEKYTDFLGQYIVDNYALADKRNDPNYFKWNELYQNFENLTATAKSAILDIKEKQQAEKNG